MEAMEYLHPYCTHTTTSHYHLELLNRGTVMEGNYNPPLSCTSEADFSTGYLEDALVEFSQQFKRRRLLFYPNCQTGFGGVSDEEPISSSMNPNFYEVKGFEDEEHPYSSSSSCKLDDDPPANHFISGRKSPFSTNSVFLAGEVEKRKKTVAGGGSRRVVYPFDVVKPGGVEGEVTLKEINDQIMMPPTRPVRHPVGEFACRSCVLSAGVGLSGKAVVALTRIQTHGQGTITIIRTKG